MEHCVSLDDAVEPGCDAADEEDGQDDEEGFVAIGESAAFAEHLFTV